MVRVDIESIVMGAGPIPSAILLRERLEDEAKAAKRPRRALSIPTGAFEAASVGRGIEGAAETDRPVAHDLMLTLLGHLDARIERVEIDRMDAPLFFATLYLASPKGEIALDVRPSDALALAARANAPVFVEDDVMNRAAQQTPVKADGEELERFDEFVQTLSPDDF